MEGFKNDMKQKIIQCKGNDFKLLKKNDTGKYISSNLPTEKRRKTYEKNSYRNIIHYDFNV